MMVALSMYPCSPRASRRSRAPWRAAPRGGSPSCGRTRRRAVARTPAPRSPWLGLGLGLGSGFGRGLGIGDGVRPNPNQTHTRLLARDRQLARDGISRCGVIRHSEGGRRNLGHLGTLGTLGDLGGESCISRGDHISGGELQLGAISGGEIELELASEAAKGERVARLLR
eukprot:scaffold48974_cov55-Phaeocystis_antarctica.AAC.2